jgi:acetyl esterase/lipase
MSGRATKLLQDSRVVEKVLLLFDDDLSPGLVDNRTLAEYPKTYIFVCEYDSLRDEQFMFAERMRRAGVNVTVRMFKKTYHSDFFNNKLYKNKNGKLVEWIGSNIDY